MKKTATKSLCVGFCALVFVALLPRCSELTEIVVAVDTDLTAGQDFDRVEVRVQNESFGETKQGDVKTASALPLTLGVAAGADTSANVLVEATAFKGQASVARTTVTAKMVDGQRKLLHVSLCRSCPPSAQCGRSFGTSMPDYTNELPSANECTGVFADAGGFDSGTPPNDSGPPNDGSTSPDVTTDGGGCGGNCPTGTQCKFGECKLTDNHECTANPYVVAATTTLHGTICPGKGTSLDFGATCGTVHPTAADIFQLESGSWMIKLRSKGSDVILRATNSGCTSVGGVPGCTTAKAGGGDVGTSASGAIKIAIGAGKAECADYDVTFTKQ